jgi:hypothetical protein
MKYAFGKVALFFSVCVCNLGCVSWLVDLESPYLRSDIVTSPEKSREILAKASLSRTTDGHIKVLHLAGSPYEIGYQHGALLKDEVRHNLTFLYERAVKVFLTPELFAESYERMRPFIPQAYIDEMHGLAHGSGLPLHVVHAVHALPEMGEWGGKKDVKDRLKKLLSGEWGSGDWGTSCSNLAAGSGATLKGEQLVVRILDWGLHKISDLHKHTLITVVKPDEGIPFANIGWIGFIGSISGMNASGITLGEMGYGSPPNETLRGMPMPFLLREVLRKAKNLSDVRHLISTSPGTNSFVYLMSDGKTKEAEMYVRDRDRFLVFPPGVNVADGDKAFPAIPDFVYGGHYPEKMNNELRSGRGKITVELLQKRIIPEISMNSNFQNVIYAPGNLEFWVSYAASSRKKAAENTYSHFSLREALK